MAILVSLESLQNGYELHEKVLIRMGWDMATAQAEKKFNSPASPVQQPQERHCSEPNGSEAADDVGRDSYF